MRGQMIQMEEVGEGFEALPEGEYLFEVTETVDTDKDGNDRMTKNGDPFIGVTLTVVTGEYRDRKVFDNIILSGNPESPGWKIRWRAKMFLKAIGEPHKGDDFEWDSDKWKWAKCLGLVVHEIIQEGARKGQKKAVISRYSPLLEGQTNLTAQETNAALKVPFKPTTIDEDLPF